MSGTNSHASTASEYDAIVDATVGIADASFFKFVLTPNAEDTMRERFMRYCVGLYKKIGWKGSALPEYFAEDFSSFDDNMFAQVNCFLRRDLRDTLRKQEVYVRNGRQILNASALCEVVQNDLLWPDDNGQTPLVEGVTSTASHGGPDFVRSALGANSDLFKYVANVSKSYYGSKERYVGNKMITSNGSSKYSGNTAIRTV